MALVIWYTVSLSALVLVTHSEAAAARADRVVRLRADGVYP